MHTFIRKLSVLQEHDTIPQNTDCPVGRFHPGNICNVDQTPIPFDWLAGRTYANKGEKTIWVKSSGSGLDKRQATAQLTICGDGIPRIKPLVVFRGKGIKV